MHTETQDFEEIYTAFQPKIHRYLVRLIGEPDAEDLTQEVFVKANQALGNFRGESTLSTWLYRIATNAAYDRLRNQTFRRDRDECPSADDLENWLHGDEPSAEQLVVRYEMNTCINRFIQNLPEDYRTVLVLSELEGLRNNEIASILGVSLDTVKIRLHRAREKLRQALMTHCDAYWLEDNESVPELRF